MNKILIEKLPKILNINIWIIKYENKNEPIEPETVLLGLIFVNFGPPKIFPKRIHQYQKKYTQIKL